MQLLTATRDKELVIVEMSLAEWSSILDLCGLRHVDPVVYEEFVDGARLLYKKNSIASHAHRLHALLADFIASGEVSP